MWASGIGSAPSAPPSAASRNPPSFSDLENAFSSFLSFIALARRTHYSVDWRNFLSIMDDSDDIDDYTPATSLDDALHKLKETLRKTKEDLQKMKEKYHYIFKDRDSESDSSDSDIVPLIRNPEFERILAEERRNKKSKSKVPVQTESSSRASPNWNPLHEALQEVAKESKGLSDETIASFRLSKFKSGFSSRSKKSSKKPSKKLSDNCALCQSAIRKGEYIITLPCKHYFHEECITCWLKMNKVCCMCRYEIEEN